ncbi:hypothetical protein P3X46_018351 [Hevea brasiliensis]|uniref:Uncharacterized protein n=1 Tax=Hevea brasiliensis TaxID=3981 RepID=A0ABQ9LQJ8_HEVBR|nr:hypothetical protein P3X46_018351 [Hevea brasiliensis]
MKISSCTQYFTHNYSFVSPICSREKRRRIFLVFLQRKGNLTKTALPHLSMFRLQREVDMMMEASATAVGLGPLNLCVETATMALLATLMLWSDAQQLSNAYMYLQVRFVKYFASYAAPSICLIQIYPKEMAYKN